MSIVNRIRGAYDNRRSYNRIVRELRAMPLDVALDLDMDRADAARVASKAVYGR